MQAKTLGVLVANTQNALEKSEKERKANEQIQRVENFVKDLTMNLNNMLAKLYWLKEQKKRQHKEMTPDQLNTMADFARWVKYLTQKVGSVLEYFQKSPAFAEKVDRDIKELEAHIKDQLKKFNEILEETPDTLTTRLIKFARNITGDIGELLQIRDFVLTVANRRKPDELSKKSVQDIGKNFLSQIPNTNDDKLENLFNSSNIKSLRSDEKKSKCLMDLKV